MKQVRLFIVACLIVSTFSVSAQDIHFSLFNMSPLTLNPAQTGAFEGTARIGGIYRDQWASFLRDQFTTTVFYVDAPVIRGFGKNDWVGVGLTSINDKNGDLGLRKSANLFSASYHRSLSRRNADHILTLGVQGGSIARSIDLSNILLGNVIGDFDSDILRFAGIVQDNGLENTGTTSREREESFFDISVGLMLRSVINERARLEVGIAGIHLTNAENPLLIRKDTTIMGEELNADPDYRQPFLLNFHSRLRYQLTDDWTLTPGLLVRSIEGSPMEAIVQAWAGRRINKDFDLNFGTAYRFGDAAQVLIGMDYLKDLKIALSYDINLSSLNTATNYQGGFELSAAYIIKLYKQPETNPTILCPKF